MSKKVEDYNDRLLFNITRKLFYRCVVVQRIDGD